MKKITILTKLVTLPDLVVVAIMAVYYWITRLHQLLLIPIFTDEAIYMRWSQIGSYDAAWRYIPLTDGKPPLYHWFVMLTIRLFDDPLYAGRIVSVFSGFISLVLVWLLAYVLFKNKIISHLAGLMYVVSPFMLVYDRLAVVDGMLTTISIGCLLFAVLLVKKPRLDTALILGTAVGAGLLTKASGLLFLLLTPSTGLLLPWKNKKRLFKTAGYWLVLLVLAGIIAQIVYAILRLSQFFYRINQKNYEFIIPLSEFLKEPFSLFWGNIQSMISWQIGYLTLPIAALVIISMFSKQYLQEKLVLLGYYMAPFVMIAAFNKVIFPRFLVFSAPWLLVLAAVGLYLILKKINTNWVKVSLITAFCVLPVRTSLAWITNPGTAGIPQSDKNQYYQDIPSGHGVREILDILEEAAKDSLVYVGTDGTFGLTPDAFLLYTRDNPAIHIDGFYPVDVVPEKVFKESKTKQAYFIYYNVQDIPTQDNIELVGEYPKVSPQRTTYLRLYKVNPKND